MNTNNLNPDLTEGHRYVVGLDLYPTVRRIRGHQVLLWEISDPLGGEPRATSTNAVEDKVRDAISPHEEREKQRRCAYTSKCVRIEQKVDRCSSLMVMLCPPHFLDFDLIIVCGSFPHGDRSEIVSTTTDILNPFKPKNESFQNALLRKCRLVEFANAIVGTRTEERR
ncbi:N-acetyltransferase complex ARD1 subunit [Perkinsela sp. CCAP 1560/4]|nr:N-acetyltransferase complex ARD1 subunit [Perkinsela sp. CCAP 1560/4]|eukprot:KNH06275.1 N-acetyltransferase complex ARD1 subunit [Perkinsela sp. CCAP 1560/4]